MDNIPSCTSKMQLLLTDVNFLSATQRKRVWDSVFFISGFAILTGKHLLTLYDNANQIRLSFLFMHFEVMFSLQQKHAWLMLEAAALTFFCI